MMVIASLAEIVRAPPTGPLADGGAEGDGVGATTTGAAGVRNDMVDEYADCVLPSLP